METVKTWLCKMFAAVCLSEPSVCLATEIATLGGRVETPIK
jgi:hypothetical protein